MDDNGEDPGGAENVAGLDDLDTGDMDVEQLLMAVLQSSLEDGGTFSSDALEELGRDFPNLDLAELIQQLQGGVENEPASGAGDGTIPSDQILQQPPPPPASSAGTEPIFPTSSVRQIVRHEASSAVPSPAAQEIEIFDLENNQAAENVVATRIKEEKEVQQSPLVIIKSEEGGITVCHDGTNEDLRPKTVVPPPSQSQQLVQSVSSTEVKTDTQSISSETKVKMEPQHQHHHQHKEKKKDKDKDRDKERHREEKERKKRQKEEEQKTLNVVNTPLRHPAFLKNRKKYGLLDTSVTIIKIDTIISVSMHMRLKRRRLNIIEEQDRKRQTQVNNKTAKIRLVPRPRPAFEYEKIESSSKRKHSDSKSKDDTKRKKIRVISDSSESEEENYSSKKHKSNTTTNKKDKEHRSSKPHGEFSATGARILPFEKSRTSNYQSKEKEHERIIRRPKMAEPETKKEVKKDRVFNAKGNEESEKKLQSVLQEAIARQKAQMKAQAQQALQFKIPKANVPPRESALDAGRYQDRSQLNQPSMTTPLRLIRQEEKKHFDQGRKFVPNSYGQHRQGNRFPDFGGNGAGDGGMGGFTNTPDFAEAEAARRDIQQRLLMRADADRFDDDEAPADMHDDAGSDDNEVLEEPLLEPVKEISLGPLARTVCDLLSRRINVQYPTTLPAMPFSEASGGQLSEPSLADVTIQKCAWWFQGIDKQAFTAVLTIPINPEADDMAPLSDGGRTVSSFGHVSNPGEDRSHVTEFTQADIDHAENPDVKDEHCGRALIDASYRISADDQFQKILDCPRGTNYDRSSFSGTCTICKVKLKSKRELGAHVRSEDHRTNFKKISLEIMPNYDRSVRQRSEEVVERVARNPVLLSEPIRPSITIDRDREKTRDTSSRNGKSSSNASKNSKKEDSSKKSAIEDRSTKTSRDELSKKSKDPSKPGEESTLNSKKSDASSSSAPKKDRKGKDEERVDNRVCSKAGIGSHVRRSPQSSRKRRSRSRSPGDRHRRRSRSPRYRRRTRSKSRSPRRRSGARKRSTSAEKVAKFLERTRRSRSPSSRKRSRRSRSRSPSPKVRVRKSWKHPPIFSDKLKLQAAGKWMPHHEENWRLMEEEEKALDKEISDLRDMFCDRPEEHPQYEGEWQEYWKKTYHEVEMSGHNADTFDYVPGWKVQWAKRAEELMEQMHYNKLGEIRLKHGMDLTSLQRLLLDLPPTPTPGPPIQQEVIMIHRQPPPPPPGTQDIYTPFDDDLYPRAMSLGSSTGKSNGEPAPPGVTPDQIVTTDTIQKTWALLTGISAPAPPKSDRSGSTMDGLDLEMELIEVLRLMSGLEDQLSILAPQVEDYFKRAETMELVSSRKSYDLLEDKDFVALLFQCRDKFMALIRANILTREVLKRMNKAVFGLNSILDSEPCQRLRPKAVREMVPDVEIQKMLATSLEPELSSLDFDSIRRPEADRSQLATPAVRHEPTSSNTMGMSGEASAVRTFELSGEGQEILNRVQRAFITFTPEQRYEIASIIAGSVEDRPFVMSDEELMDYIQTLMEPTLQILDSRTRERESSRRPPSPNPFCISLDAKREFVRGVGTALPPFPEMQCRAALSPPRHGHMVQHFQAVRGAGRTPQLPGLGSRESYSGPQQPYPRPGPDGRSGSLSPNRFRGMSPGRMRGSHSLSPGYIPSLMSPRPLPLLDLDLSPLISPVRNAFGGAGTPPSPYYERSNSRTPQVRTSSPESEPGPSRVRNHENENVPPLIPNRSQGPHDEADDEIRKQGKELEKSSLKGGGSPISPGSICNSNVNEGHEEGQQCFELKKGSLSGVSSGSASSGHRSKLKELNVKQTHGALLPDNVSDVESGEILSSEDAESVSSSVQERRRKLQEQKIQTFKLIKSKQRERRKEKKKELVKWFQGRSHKKLDDCSEKQKRLKNVKEYHSRKRIKAKKNGEEDTERSQKTRGEKTGRDTNGREKAEKRRKPKGDHDDRRHVRLHKKRRNSDPRTERRRRRPSSDSHGRDSMELNSGPRRAPPRSEDEGSQHTSRHTAYDRYLPEDHVENRSEEEFDYDRTRSSIKPDAMIELTKLERRRQRFCSSGSDRSTRPDAMIELTKLERRRQRFCSSSSEQVVIPTSSIRQVSNHSVLASAPVLDGTTTSKSVRQRRVSSPLMIELDNHPPPIPALDVCVPVLPEGEHGFEVVSGASSISSLENEDAGVFRDGEEKDKVYFVGELN